MKRLNDVIKTLIETNDKLISGAITLEVAKQVATNTQVLINAAKVYIDFAKLSGSNTSNFLSETTEMAKEVEVLKPTDEPITATWLKNAFDISNSDSVTFLSFLFKRNIKRRCEIESDSLVFEEWKRNGKSLI